MENSNVQEIREGIKLASLDVNSIKPDPRFPTIRGRIKDTTDLQASIKEVGVLMPIHVRPDDQNPGEYFLISGARRLVAARQIGLETIPALVDDDVDENKVRRMMLASGMHEKTPHLVLDAEGNVIGGNCWGVFKEVEGGTDRKDLAPWMGETSDVIGAYYRLFHEISAIKRKVEKGDMGITVYALIKRQPLEVREYVAKKRGRITARWVRKTLREWRDMERVAEETKTEAGEEPDPKAGYVAYEPVQGDNIPLLNSALASLKQVQDPESPIERMIVNQIEGQIARFVA